MPYKQASTFKSTPFPTHQFKLYSSRGNDPVASDAARLVLIEALHRFPLIRRESSCNITPHRSNRLGHPGSWSLHRLRCVQDYLYEATDSLISLSLLAKQVLSLGFHWNGQGNLNICAKRSRAHTFLEDITLPINQADTECADMEHDDSGFFDSINLKAQRTDLARGTDFYSKALIQDFEVSAGSLPSETTVSSLLSQPIIEVSSPKSMSRRRIASQLPALMGQVSMPPPPTPADFLGYSGTMKSPRRSPGLTIIPPKLLHVAGEAKVVPATPVDQVITKPAVPPKLERPTVDQELNWSDLGPRMAQFSFGDTEPLFSPCIINGSSGLVSISQRDLLSPIPKTPLEQVMSIPSEPPAMPHRSRRPSFSTQDRRRNEFEPAFSGLRQSIMATPRPASGICQVPGDKSTRGILNDDNKANPFINTEVGDLEATPRPAHAATGQKPMGLGKARPPSLFSHLKPQLGGRPMIERRALTDKSNSLSVKSSLAAAGLSCKDLPLGSPLALDHPSAQMSPEAKRPTTPLVGVSPQMPATPGLGRTGTPSYFSARSYFVKH